MHNSETTPLTRDLKQEHSFSRCVLQARAALQNFPGEYIDANDIRQFLARMGMYCSEEAVQRIIDDETQIIGIIRKAYEGCEGSPAEQVLALAMDTHLHLGPGNDGLFATWLREARDTLIALYNDVELER